MNAATRSIRPAAVVVAVLLVAGAVHSTPASADDSDATFVIEARAVYPYEQVPGMPGGSPYVPADAGLGPGSVSLSVVLYNRTEYALHDISVTPRIVKNGQVDSIRCATSPIFPDDVPLQDGVLQGEPPPFPTPPPPSPAPRPPTWTDLGLMLAPHKSLYCDVEVSGITDKVLNETVTSATALRVEASTPATYDAHTWAAAGKLRQGFPVPEPASILGLAFVDSNENYIRDVYPDEPEKTEPVLSGLRVTLTGPDGKPVPLRTGQGVVGPEITDQDGSYNYTFWDLRPYTSFFTVTLDLDSPGLAGWGKARDAEGTWDSGRRTWTQTVRSGGNFYAPWRLVPGNRVYLTMEAPRTAVAGTPLTITGRAARADSRAAGGPVILEAAPPANPPTDWKKLADVTNRDGRLSVSLNATRTADLRFRYLGDDHTSGSVQWPHRRFSVFAARVALSVKGPATARQGERIAFSGTIERAGKPFQSGRIILQYAPDDNPDLWTTVAEVRSTAGAMSATAQATGTGYYRWRYRGDSRTAVGNSPNLRVVVSP